MRHKVVVDIGCQLHLSTLPREHMITVSIAKWCPLCFLISLVESLLWVVQTLRLSGIVGLTLGKTKMGLMISFISGSICLLLCIPMLLAMRTHPCHGKKAFDLFSFPLIIIFFVPLLRLLFIFLANPSHPGTEIEHYPLVFEFFWCILMRVQSLHFTHFCPGNVLELRAVRPRTAVKPSGPQRELSSTSDGVASRKKTLSMSHSECCHSDTFCGGNVSLHGMFWF